MNTNIKYIFTTMAMIGAGTLSAAVEPSLKDSVLSFAYENVIALIGLSLVLLAFFAIWRSIESLMEYHKREIFEAQGLTMPEKKPSIGIDQRIKAIYQKAWSLVPMDKESDIDLGHDYDGIRELDNSLPPWWLYTFYFTIIFGIGYLYIYHYSDIGLSQQEEYEVAMKEAKAQKIAALAAQANSVNESNVIALVGEGDLNAGKEIYNLNCAACHGALGEGGVGPNLTDDYWIHGGSINDVFKTIKYGVPQKGMIAWQAQLQPSSIQKISSYILTLHGTNPPNAKDPQGVLYTPGDLSME